jgi:short-subunit dehydrogenase
MVTGASSGIGLSFAHKLAANGHDLVLVARTEPRLKEVAGDVGRVHGVDAEVLAADLSDDDDIERVAARLADEGRPIDLLVNNAGFGTFGAFSELPIEGEEREIKVNVLALVKLTRAALPGMVTRGKGGIINVSSVASFQPGPWNATYSATKAFVTSFTQAVHEESRGTGVKVVALCPGFTRTEFQERAGVPASAVPGMLWQGADQVVDVALKSLRQGRAVAIPGVLNKLAASFSQRAPRSMSRRMSGSVGRRLEQ